MSAFTVDKAHIDTLVNAALTYANIRDHTYGDGIGRMLWAENYRSVNHRYDDAEDIPDYRATLTDAELSPVAVLKAIDCYEYQSCEHPAWEQSDANQFATSLRAVILSRHPELGRQVPSRYERTRTTWAYKQTPEYDAAPWEVTDLAQVTVQRQAVIVAEQAEEEAHRGEGAVYRSVGRLDITEIAKRMRANLRNAQAVGMLPEDATFSVRTSRFAGGQSITVTVHGMPDAWTYTTRQSMCGQPERVYSDQARATTAAIQAMLDEYNRDRSDIQTDYFDVWFYDHVNIEDERSAQWRAQEKQRKAQRAAARKARKV